MANFINLAEKFILHDCKDNQSISQNVVSVSSVIKYDVTISFPLKFLHLRSILDLRFFVKTITEILKEFFYEIMSENKNKIGVIIFLYLEPKSYGILCYINIKELFPLLRS